MAGPRWEFSIDVGGTFTDCLAKAPDGSPRRHKLLSSGATLGRVHVGSSIAAIVDPQRRQDPLDFWVGWRIAVLRDTGEAVDSAIVTKFDATAGRLHVDGLAHSPAPGAAYELRCDEEAPIVAIRYLLAVPLAMPVPSVVLRLGTTRGTNALLTRTGARTALVTTRGFGDVLEIGYQARPRLFDLAIRKPPLLTSAVAEIDERVTHDGRVLLALDECELRQQLQSLAAAGIESLAICFLHADRHPEHERRLAAVARELGFHEVSCSSEVAPLPKLVPRADTTVVDAYLNPILREYVERLRSSLPGSSLRLLTSAGGLVAADRFCGKDSILSGPAGGVIGFSRVAQAAGFERAIGFDMGGTSTDVSRFDGRYELEYETQKAGVRLVAPTMAIETVAAGGGSICRFDGVKLTVGPQSAGADPGPACYGRGGPLTVTDCNYFLGRLVAERFPFPLDRAATERRLQEIQSQVAMGHLTTDVTGPSQSTMSLEELAAGFLRIANANMAAAIRQVTIANGANPADYVLVAFGGAAPQHACAIARELGIRHILNHPEGGVLSALGIGQADVTRHSSFGIERPLDPESLAMARQKLDEQAQQLIEEICQEGVSPERNAVTRSLDLRYQGIDACLTIAWPADDDFPSAFAAEHRRRYGYTHDGRPLEIAAARLEVAGRVAEELGTSVRCPRRSPPPTGRTSAYFAGGVCDTPLFDRVALTPGDIIDGPAIVTEEISTTVIDPGWQAEVLSGGELLVADLQEAAEIRNNDRRTAAPLRSHPRTELDLADARRQSPDPVLLEVFNNHLASIADQMGVTLRNTASSVNVKERLDFSSAIFTADGALVANAQHIPVHLGAMEETIRHAIAANTDLRPGDVIATNDPYAGGSHLPDVTVITPVHDQNSGELLFFTASRAHHAEIGGIVPGSMPPLSKNLAEEGVLIRNLKIVDAGTPRFDKLRALLLSGRYPTRDVAANLADVAAQVAANRQGADDLLALVERYSWPVVRDYMNHVQDAAERKLRLALARLPAGQRRCIDYLELADGRSVPICVTITTHPPHPALSKEERKSILAATIDFTGTGPVVEGNLNANRAIVTAATIYVLRLLIAEDIPLNHGVLRPVEIALPNCLLNPQPGPTPETTPAVVGGNVETSQRVVDVLLGAFGLAGASQGTMNNVVFGDATFGYYETICGGSGATGDAPGASAVQVHMTNTRLTDPEILERRYPVRVREFSVRRGSGGRGRQRGGDGTVRQLEFLRSLELSLLTQRRGPHPPYGASGGEPGALGRNRMIRADGTEINLGGIAQLRVAPGDVLIVETPGGGGYGKIVE